MKSSCCSNWARSESVADAPAAADLGVEREFEECLGVEEEEGLGEEAAAAADEAAFCTAVCSSLFDAEGVEIVAAGVAVEERDLPLMEREGGGG